MQVVSEGGGGGEGREGGSMVVEGTRGKLGPSSVQLCHLVGELQGGRGGGEGDLDEGGERIGHSGGSWRVLSSFQCGLCCKEVKYVRGDNFNPALF